MTSQLVAVQELEQRYEHGLSKMLQDKRKTHCN